MHANFSITNPYEIGRRNQQSDLFVLYYSLVFSIVFIFELDLPASLSVHIWEARNPLRNICNTVDTWQWFDKSFCLDLRVCIRGPLRTELKIRYRRMNKHQQDSNNQPLRTSALALFSCHAWSKSRDGNLCTGTWFFTCGWHPYPIWIKTSIFLTRG
jgi:hypothetical protein